MPTLVPTHDFSISNTLLPAWTVCQPVRNGGVHQFFYNSEGSLAPDVHEAMLELGMTEQAAIFKRGLDMFSKPYLRDTKCRREVDFRHDGWND
jgi:hypothetical protein